jgi:transcriptional regulator with XRE-family HTH domain
MTINLGDKIRQLRKSKGLTQELLAEQIGIDNKHLSRIEKNKHMPTYHVLKKLAKVLDFDIYNIDDMKIEEIAKPDKTFVKSLHILNSAKTDEEKKYFLEALQHAQKGLKIGSNQTKL